MKNKILFVVGHGIRIISVYLRSYLCVITGFRLIVGREHRFPPNPVITAGYGNPALQPIPVSAKHSFAHLVLIFSFLILSFSFLLSACGNRETSTPTAKTDSGKLAVTLKWGKDAKRTASAAPSGVATVRITITASDMNTITQDFNASLGGGTITSVPTGNNRTITVYGLDSSGYIKYKGSLSGITIAGGQTTTVAILLLAQDTSQAPIASLTSDKTTGGTPLTVTFTIGYIDPEGANGTYSLDFGDGSTTASSSINTSGSNQISHTYSTRGSYTATLTVTDDHGVQGTKTTKITAGGTPLSGIISQNKTLTLTETPYLINGNVQIPDGVTLTIEPGVTLIYTGAYEILVKGNIIANGTASNLITFTSSLGNTSSGATQIRFSNSNLSNSELNYLKMEWAAISIQVGKHTAYQDYTEEKDTGTLIVSHIEIANSKIMTAGYETTANLVLSNATLTSATVIGVYPRSEPIEINGATISNSTITSDSYNKGIKVLNSTVSNTNFNMGCCGANIRIENSTVMNSPTVGCCGSPVSGPYEIVKSNITNSSINLPNAQVKISDSTFSYNSNVGIKMGNGIVEYSKILGQGSGIGIELTGYADNIGGNWSISNTEINGTATGIKITGGSPTISNSNFINSTSYHIENRSGSAITATNNYWDTTDANTIATKIFDYYDDITYGKVTFDPFLTAPVSTAGPRP